MSNGYEDRHAYDDAGNEIYRKSPTTEPKLLMSTMPTAAFSMKKR